MILNQRLKSLRLENRVTQQSIANAIGVTVGNLQKFEYGTTRPKRSTPYGVRGLK